MAPSRLNRPPGRSHQHQQHDAVDQGLSPYRWNPKACETLHLRQQQRGDDRADDAAHAAYNDHGECHDEKIVAHGRKHRVDRTEQCACQSREAAAVEKGQAVYQPDRNPERCDHGRIDGGGAQNGADLCAVYEPPGHQDCGKSGCEDEQAIARHDDPGDIHDSGEWGCDRMGFRAPQHLRDVAQDEANAERQEQSDDGAIRSRQQRTNPEFFEAPADQADQNWHQDKRAPIPRAPADQREGRVAAQHVDVAVRQVDDIKQAENHREPQCHQGQRHADDQRVDDLGQHDEMQVGQKIFHRTCCGRSLPIRTCRTCPDRRLRRLAPCRRSGSRCPSP